MKNQAVFGASFDHATVGYTQSFQYGSVTPARSVAIIAAAANPAYTVNRVNGGARTFGVYLTDTLSASRLWHITASARYNRIHETLGGESLDTDLTDFSINPGDNLFYQPLGVSGDHSYSRVNPFIGATYTPDRTLTLFANYNEGSRAPTVIELGCANPAQPCGLPNNFAGDPDLKQVVSRTVEIGARGAWRGELLQWSADLFHTENSDDIQFIAATSTQGYFANVGGTRRQGLDLSVGGRPRAGLSWHLVYSFVDATYQSGFLLNAGANSTADADGNIMVHPGNRIPLIPRHTARLRLEYSKDRRFDLGGSLIVSSGVFLHGDENNANVADGRTVIGSGTLPGYFVVNLDGTWHASRTLDVFMRINNVLDKRYATAGFLTSNAFNPDGSFRPNPGDWTNENLVSPAAPLGVWVGVRVHLED
jgi:iron complex outermembrane recepter protein